MSGSFRTSDGDPNPDLRPVRVAQRREDVFSEARNLAGELQGWSILESDEARGVLVCERKGGLLAGASRVTFTFEGPADLPSTTVNARSETRGWLPRDRARVQEFMRLLHRRVG